jgi:hypothetical protein
MADMRLWAGAASLALLGACEAKVGPSADNASADGNAQSSAEGRAEEGKVRIDTPGFDLTINVPKEAMRTGHADGDSGPLYPGASIGGVHVAGGAGGGEGEVEMRFTTLDAPEKVAAWYRDPARADRFSLTDAGREGNGFVLAGTEKDGGDRFRVRLAPASGGGTDGRLTVSSNN